MNEEYYGSIQASEDFLAHYGVKGMKWGVRRALERKSANSAALARHYARAVKKLKKLNAKADINRSQTEAKGRFANAASAGVAGAVSGGVAAGLNAAKVGGGGWLPIGAGLAAVDAGYHLARGIAARRRTTPEGHAKAKAKADQFRKEMQQAFKGTKYSKLQGAKGMSKAYQYDSFGTQMKNAARAAAVSPYYANARQVGEELDRKSSGGGKKRRR